MSTTMTIRLDTDTRQRLEALAESTERSKSWLAAQAIRDYIVLNEWQVSETQAAIKEADAGDFASDKELSSLADRWLHNAG